MKKITNTIMVTILAFIVMGLNSCNKDDNNDHIDNEDVLTDNRDGQTYRIVQIGDQTWMAENLNYDAGMNDCFIYDNDTCHAENFGRLYQWPVVKYVCPEGWHLPGDDEWTQLSDFLGGLEVAGGKMKEKGTGLWETPNTGATNASGFSAAPGGYYNEANMVYCGLYSTAYFWTSTHMDGTQAWCRYMRQNSGSLFRAARYDQNGMSVRCVKN